MSAERLRQYAVEVRRSAAMEMTEYEAGYMEGLRKAADLLDEWEREEGA